MAVACPTEIVDDDERGFTTAGRDHQFDPEAADRGVGTAPRRRKWTLLGGKRRRSRTLKTLSMPVAPADIGLDGTETLKADRSFRSPNSSSEDESSSGTSTSRSGSGERKKGLRITQNQTRYDSESESVGSPVSWW